MALLPHKSETKSDNVKVVINIIPTRIKDVLNGCFNLIVETTCYSQSLDFGVVQYAHNTSGSSSGHSPLASSSFFFNMFSITLLEDSVWPLAAG